MAVITPTGICCGANRVRANVSARTRKLPPANNGTLATVVDNHEGRSGAESGG